MKTLTINVTQDIIDAALRDIAAEPYPVSVKCPVARALTEHLLPGMFARVSGDSMSVNLGDINDPNNADMLCEIPLPAEVGRFIGAFDNRHHSTLATPPPPFSFDLVLEA